MISGKLVISTIVVVAVAMAGFAWWARYSQSQQVLTVWGKDAVVLIRTGKKVELLKAARQEVPDAGSGERPVQRFELPGSGQSDADQGDTDQGDSGQDGAKTVSIAFRTERDLSETPGLIHCRHHLVHQKGFDWTANRKEGCDPQWNVGLRFSNVKQDGSSNQSATMLFDFACNRVFLVERQAEVTMRPIIADALKEFFADLGKTN